SFLRLCFSFFLRLPPPLGSTLFPYTTLFRSGAARFAEANTRTGHGHCSIGIRVTGKSLVGSRDTGGTCDHRGRRPCAARSTQCRDRKSTRLNSSHDQISYAVFCLKKKRTSTK